jgi:hypothetical protein
VEVEFNIPSKQQQLMFEGRPLGDKQRLTDAGVKDNDMLLLDIMAAPRPAANRPAAGNPVCLCAHACVLVYVCIA